MTNDTRALGKDASYEETISNMTRLLNSRQFEIEEVSWQNPVPNVWSVHIRDRNCPQLFTNGKGHSKNAALASALGEFHERLACDYFFSEYSYEESISRTEFVHHPKEKWFPIDADFSLENILPNNLATLYDPDREFRGEELVDFNSADTDRGICALPFTRIQNNETVYFPANILNNLYVSNGMAAGNTLHEARVQALSEIIERHTKNRVIAECITLPDIPQEVLRRYPAVLEGIAALEEHGFHILVKDASLGEGLPVVNVTLLNPNDNGVYAAFGAHPIFEVALERTLTELLQGRSLDRLNDFPPPSMDREEVEDASNLEVHFINATGRMHLKFLSANPDFAFCDWDFKGDTEQQYQFLASVIHSMGKEIFVADYHHFGVYCCRIVVPGMSEIYPIDDLLLENNSIAIPVRRAILSPSTLTEDTSQSLYEFMEEMSFPREQPISNLTGILPPADTLWENICVGEFNTLLCLAAKDVENAILWSEWCATSPLLSPPRQNLFRCIYTLLRTEQEAPGDSTHYEASLKKLYGEKLFSKARFAIDGKAVFADLPDFSAAQASSPHAKLLDAYRKCRRAKDQRD